MALKYHERVLAVQLDRTEQRSCRKTALLCKCAVAHTDTSALAITSQWSDGGGTGDVYKQGEVTQLVTNHIRF